MKDGTAVVTGGTGGLGKTVVEALVEEGWTVHVPSSSEASARKLGEEVDGGDRLRLHRADLTDPGAVSRFFAAVEEASGGVDALCNLVGGFAMGPLEETDPKTWDKMWGLNATAPFLAIRGALPLLARSSAPRVVNVAAAAALDGPKSGMAAYLASKSALVSLTRNLARELGPKGITVNAVAPTVIDTPANRKAMPAADGATWITPGEMAGVIRWLLGPEAAVVTGNVLELRKG